MELSHQQMKAMKAASKRANEDKYLEQSKRRLDKIITTKMRTAFIGALAAFEEEFGFLWGHELDEDELTEEQLEMHDKWMDARTAVLNNGNGQLRALRQELENHMIKWNRYQTSFIIQEQEDG